MSKKCYKAREGKAICGVCKGVANYFQIDVLLVRIIWAVLTFGGFGIGALLYVVFAIALPEEPYNDGYHYYNGEQ